MKLEDLPTSLEKIDYVIAETRITFVIYVSGYRCNFDRIHIDDETQSFFDCL